MEEDKKEFKFKGPETHHGYTVYTVMANTYEEAKIIFDIEQKQRENQSFGIFPSNELED